MSKAFISIILGIVSLVPGMIFICGGMWIDKCIVIGTILENYFFVFYPLAFILGMIGVKIGIKAFKLNRLTIVGLILSILGTVSSLLIFVFGLYTAQF